MSLALVYISRGIDGGLSSAKAFFATYHDFPAGCPHELIVIVKGWAGVPGENEMRELALSHAARLIDMTDDGFDWGAYMRLAPMISHDWTCFLNTHSRPCVNGWLKFLNDAIEFSPIKNIGAVGSTASWETLTPILPLPSENEKYNNPFIYPIRLLRNLVRYAMNMRDFPLFPNPHLRSNAFIVRRELFVDFVATKKIPRCKRDAIILESGRYGFSSYLVNNGLELLVAGADGNLYGSEQWDVSGTFRVAKQPNLLIRDNQTIAYDIADQHLKKILERFAWGRTSI